MNCLDIYKDAGSDCVLIDPLEVLKYMEIPYVVGYDTSLIEEMIKTAQCYFELYTRRSLVQREFTLITSLWDCGKKIMRSPLVSISEVKYKDSDGNDIIVDSSLYYIFDQYEYSYLKYDENFTYPSLFNRPQSIEVKFIAGIVPDCNQDALPDDIKIGLMELVTGIYESRGDCGCSDSMLSATSKGVFNKYKIYGI
jgi:uncharacterized phiE125 gp8 family phage protein